jgi:hypothetical protein
VARHRAEDPAEQVRRDEIANALQHLRRALRARRAAIKAATDAERRVGEATEQLVELGVPVAQVAARVGVPATSLRKALRAYVLSERP